MMMVDNVGEGGGRTLISQMMTGASWRKGGLRFEVARKGMYDVEFTARCMPASKFEAAS